VREECRRSEDLVVAEMVELKVMDLSAVLIRLDGERILDGPGRRWLKKEI
jgi:hypothetical protein